MHRGRVGGAGSGIWTAVMGRRLKKRLHRGSVQFELRTNAEELNLLSDHHTRIKSPRHRENSGHPTPVVNGDFTFTGSLCDQLPLGFYRGDRSEGGKLNLSVRAA